MIDMIVYVSWHNIAMYDMVPDRYNREGIEGLHWE